MKHIKLFENFDSYSIYEICRDYGIENYTINDDGSIDVDGDVWLNLFKLEKLPLKFNKVLGDFNCSSNYLTSLVGSPRYVSGFFNCHRNKLSNLEGAPIHVDNNFDCTQNNLISLIGCPNYVGGSFKCYINELTSLEFAPNNVGEDFYCGDNNLTSLIGFKTEIIGEFNSSDKLNIIYNILKDNLDVIPNFYEFNIITNLEDEKPILNLKRLNKFIELYDLKQLSDDIVEKIKKYYNVI